MSPRLVVAMCLLGGPLALDAARDETLANPIASRIDAFLEQHWRAEEMRAAAAADDATFLRRITLDLAGRIPTYDEAREFVLSSEAPSAKRLQLIEQLTTSAEYHFHLSRVLEEIIQDRYAGDREFQEYLRGSLRDGTSWSKMFREILLGPWDTPETERASRFLSRRVRNLDELTTDTARVFFGVDISCAKCHDHPFVFDWTQDQYYGMAAFLNRTYEHRDGKKRLVGEKSAGEVSFVATSGEKKTAKMRFLSGGVVAEPGPGKADAKKDRKKSRPKGPYTPPPFSRRQRLVEIALEDEVFLSRSFVNRLWAWFMGRGLVEPLDQMHSENPPAIPGLLEWLAQDFVDSGYDIHRLVRGIVSSRAYALASSWTGDGKPPDEEHFAIAQVKPLTPAQYAASLVVATGKDALGTGAAKGQVETYERQEERARELAREAGRLSGSGALDAPSADFQSSVAEALFMSNHLEVQKLVEPRDENLVATLSSFSESGELVEAGYWAVLGRPPTAGEKAHLVDWLKDGQISRSDAVRDLTWALVTSAEFRFNH